MRQVARRSRLGRWTIVGIVLTALWFAWSTTHLVTSHAARNERYVAGMISSCKADNATLGTASDCRADFLTNQRYPIGLGAWTIYIGAQLLVIVPVWIAALALARLLRRKLHASRDARQRSFTHG